MPTESGRRGEVTKWIVQDYLDSAVLRRTMFDEDALVAEALRGVAKHWISRTGMLRQGRRSRLVSARARIPPLVLWLVRVAGSAAHSGRIRRTRRPLVGWSRRKVRPARPAAVDRPGTARARAG